MRRASLPMYDLEEVRDATDTLWLGIARHLRALGQHDVPDRLDRQGTPEETWADPALLLGQTCGYPLTHAFAGRLRVVASPVHAIAGCEGGAYYSVLIVRAGASFTSASDLRGAVAAINDHASHSGANVLFATLGSAAVLRECRVTGSHVASAVAVRRGEADVAAIDCVTHALLARWRPSALEGTRVLMRSMTAPALPYVTRALASDGEVAQLRTALTRAMTDPELSHAREALLLSATEVLPVDAYARILEIEQRHALEALSTK